MRDLTRSFRVLLLRIVHLRSRARQRFSPRALSVLPRVLSAWPRSSHRPRPPSRSDVGAFGRGEPSSSGGRCDAAFPLTDVRVVRRPLLRSASRYALVVVASTLASAFDWNRSGTWFEP